MAWNQSTGEATKPTPKKPSALRGVIAGAVVVAAAVAIFFAMSGKDEKPKAKMEKEPGLIKEVKPSAVPTNGVVKTAPKAKVDSIIASPTTNGMTDVQARIWRYHRNPPSWTNTTALTQPKSAYAIFSTPIENRIALLMTLHPGKTLVGSPFYMKDEDVTKQFLKSCETPIIVSEDDTPYQQQLKKDMIQMKIELRQRMADGEDLATILKDAWKENQRLAQVKSAIENDLRAAIRDNAKSDSDVDTFVAAANELLEKKGIAPLKLNPLTKRAFARAVSRNSQKQAERK